MKVQVGPGSGPLQRVLLSWIPQDSSGDPSQGPADDFRRTPTATGPSSSLPVHSVGQTLHAPGKGIRGKHHFAWRPQLWHETRVCTRWVCRKVLCPAHQVLLLGAAAVFSWFAKLRARLKSNADTHRQDLRNLLPFICSLPHPHKTPFFLIHEGSKHLVSDRQGVSTSPQEP